jgi:hypothetical protein
LWKKFFGKKKILWIVQYEDTILPKKISQNVILFKKSNKKIIHLNIFFILLAELPTKFFSFKNFSSSSLYSLLFYNKVDLYLKM